MGAVPAAPRRVAHEGVAAGAGLGGAEREPAPGAETEGQHLVANTTVCRARALDGRGAKNQSGPCNYVQQNLAPCGRAPEPGVVRDEPACRAGGSGSEKGMAQPGRKQNQTKETLAFFSFPRKIKAPGEGQQEAVEGGRNLPPVICTHPWAASSTARPPAAARQRP